MSRRSSISCWLLTLACGAPPLLAQEELWSFFGNSAGDEFGHALGDAGDVNADGFADVIVGAYRDDPSGSDSGSARVFSGADGTLLWVFYGAAAGDNLGHSVDGAGDINGDGHDDLIVGADFADGNGVDSGSAFVYSGFDGSLLYALHGDSPGDALGLPVRGVGDVDGDGVPDLFIGIRRDDDNATDCGAARLYSGLDGAVLYTFFGDGQGDELGHWLGGAGDVDADGVRDLIAGAHRDDNTGLNSGSARVYSGADGGILYHFDGDSPDDRFGRCVDGVGDVNADGHADFIIGAFQDDDAASNAGSAQVYSGQDGTVLFRLDGDAAGDQFGHYVSPAGDVDGDGTPDVIVGATKADPGGADSGLARLFTGRDGSVLYTFEGQKAGDFYGFPSIGAGDCDGDGLADLLVGARKNDTSATNAGKAEVRTGSRLYLDITPRAVQVGQYLRFSTGLGEPGQLTLVFVVALDEVPLFQPLPLLVPFDAAGRSTFGGVIPNSSAFQSAFALTFRAYALTSGGEVLATADEAVNFSP